MRRRFLVLSAVLLAAPSAAQESMARPNTTDARPPMTTDFRGIYTVLYRVPDLDRAKAWYAQAFQTQPYFDEPFYVGFNVSGYELGLLPLEGEQPGRGGVVAYWGVSDVDATVQRLVSLGATVHEAPQDVGGEVRVATVLDPFGNPIGIIRNPEFGRAP